MLTVVAFELTDRAHETTATQRPDSKTMELPSNSKNTTIRTPREGRNGTSVKTRNAPTFKREFTKRSSCLVLATTIAIAVLPQSFGPLVVPTVEVSRSITRSHRKDVVDRIKGKICGLAKRVLEIEQSARLEVSPIEETSLRGQIACQDRGCSK